MTTVRIALFGFCILVVPVLASPKPTPPPQLLGLFGYLEQFEAALEQEEWTQASEKAAKTGEAFSRMEPILKNERPRETASAGQALESLVTATAARDFSKAHSCYLDLQQQLIAVMDAYDYKIHPVLYLIDKFLDEADEGVREGDLNEVIHELQEIEVLFDGKARFILEQRGAAMSLTNRLADKVHEVLELAAEGGVDATQKGLVDLRKTFSVLVANFGSRR